MPPLTSSHANLIMDCFSIVWVLALRHTNTASNAKHLGQEATAPKEMREPVSYEARKDHWRSESATGHFSLSSTGSKEWSLSSGKDLRGHLCSSLIL